MLITIADSRHIDAWLSIAREMEPIFGASMADNPQFRDYVVRSTQSMKAIVALDRMNDDELMGVIAFSRSKNSISWLGVTTKYRRKSVGSRLVEAALRQLNATAAITVVTFVGQDANALAARALYEKYGFAVTDAAITHHGQPRCLMTKPAVPAVQVGASFHFQYDSWARWCSPDECPICAGESGTSGYVMIKELEHSWVGVNEKAQGSLYGKCSVLSKNHFVELVDSPRDDLSDFMTDVQIAARALKQSTGAVRINYEMHGNTVPHAHMHLFPRYLDDPFPSGPIDYRITEPSPYANEGEFEEFVSRMRRAIDEAIA
jgi:diadenosine tetraphosphate (Ap4A) HIT family hydrolase/ribosomal protein S18 acetylase RimI-like enzyme